MMTAQTSIITDEQLIAELPAGDRYTLLAISLAKRLLTAAWIKPGEQFRLLEQLHGLVDGRAITPEMLETIEPMSDTAIRILDEASGDDQNDKPINPSFDRVTCGRGFWLFLQLNPSLVAAIRLGAPKPAAPPTDEIRKFTATVRNLLPEPVAPSITDPPISTPKPEPLLPGQIARRSQDQW